MPIDPFEGHWDLRPKYQYYMNEPQDRDPLQNAVEILNGLASRQQFEDSHDQTYRRAAEAVLALNEAYHKSRDQRDYEFAGRRHAEHIVAALSESPTTVVVRNYKSEMKTWCEENLIVVWKFYEDKPQAYFMFEDMKTAAMFKLQWIEG